MGLFKIKLEAAVSFPYSSLFIATPVLLLPYKFTVPLFIKETSPWFKYLLVVLNDVYKATTPFSPYELISAPAAFTYICWAPLAEESGEW